MVLYMAVTPDELELPMAVEKSAVMLAKRVGSTADIIYSSISHKKSGKTRGMRFVRVEVTDD